MSEFESGSEALINAVERLSVVDRVGTDRSDLPPIDVVALPRGKELHSLKKFRDEAALVPDRLKGTAKLTTLKSFIEHVQRFSEPLGSVIFADAVSRPPKMVAVLDYHFTEAKPRFGQHRAVYEFPTSEQFLAWRAMIESKEIGQEAFARFLEDRILDVKHPSEAKEKSAKLAEDLGITLATPQQLLTVSQGLSIRVGRKLVNKPNLATGESTFIFEESHEDPDTNGPVKVPKGFLIEIPVFRSGAVYQLVVRLRYRAPNQQVVWSLQVPRFEASWEDAVNEACKEAKETTGLPLYFGTPES